MRESIIVVDGCLDEGRRLCAILKGRHYDAAPIDSLDALTTAARQRSCRCVILDLDTLSVDNRFIRNLLRDNPDLCVIGTSSRTFHPELEEAMRTHIFACLSKPVDEDELIYWLKIICDKAPKSEASPPGK
ncbi:MAG: response regulator [Syntrophobacteraceae bacterium]|nr:response regulator [Syntrophobacteraceae bacterium]